MSELTTEERLKTRLASGFLDDKTVDLMIKMNDEMLQREMEARDEAQRILNRAKGMRETAYAYMWLGMIAFALGAVLIRFT